MLLSGSKFVFVVSLALVLPALAAAQVPAKLGYQGRLLQADGTPATGVVSVTFSVFEEETGGVAFWAETQSIALTNGYYSVQLGQVTPLDLSLFSGRELWLEISVEGEKLSPRQVVGSVAYALRANDATNVSGGTVDAASIAVGGATVIDGGGRLVGSAAYTAGDGLELSGGAFSLAQSCAPGEILKWDGAAWGCATDDGGAGVVTAVTATAPLTSSGGAAPDLSIPAASAVTDGYLAAADWTAFDAKVSSEGAGAGLVTAGTATPPTVGLMSCPSGEVLASNGAGWACIAPYTSSNAATDIAAAVGGIDNHSRYDDTEAVAAMGPIGNTNPLRHDRFSDLEASAATGTNLVQQWQMEATSAWNDVPETSVMVLPDGREGRVHRSIENGTGCYNWALTNYFPVNPDKTYEFSIWIKSTETDLNNYFGFHAFDSSGAQIAGAWGNPYFKTGQSDPNNWVRWTAYIVPSYVTDGNSDGQPDNTVSHTNGVDWRWPAGAVRALARFGTCYGDGNNTGDAFYAYPSVREIDPIQAFSYGPRIYRSSTVATMTSTGKTQIPGVGSDFYAEAGTPVTIWAYFHQRCNDNYFYNEVTLDGTVVATAGNRSWTTWRTNNMIMWNGVVATTGNHSVRAVWEGGTPCTSNTGEIGAGGANVSMTVFAG